MLTSVLLISSVYYLREYDKLADSITATVSTLRALLPEFNGNELLYRNAETKMDRAVLKGLAYQLENGADWTSADFA